MKIKKYPHISLTIALLILPSVANAQDLASKLLIKNDELLSQGNFVFERTSYVPNLIVPPDNAPPGVVFTRTDPRVKSIVELSYAGSQFVRRVTDITNKSVVQESFDGTYFCFLSIPSPSEKEVRTNIIVERKGEMFDAAMYPNARMITIFPGAMLFQGRGVTFLKPGLKVSGATSSFEYNGRSATVIFDPVHGYVAKSLVLYSDDKHKINEIVMTKPVLLKSGVWIASDSTLKSFDRTGKVSAEMRVRFLEEKKSNDLQFTPSIDQGYIVDFMVDDQKVMFEKTTNKPLTLAELEAVARKKAPQDAFVLQSLFNKEAKDKQTLQKQRTGRVVAGVLAVVVFGAIIGVVRLLLKKR